MELLGKKGDLRCHRNARAQEKSGSCRVTRTVGVLCPAFKREFEKQKGGGEGVKSKSVRRSRLKNEEHNIEMAPKKETEGLPLFAI